MRADPSQLGPGAEVARDLDTAAGDEASRLVSLSPLTAPLAVEYLERLARPIPSLTPSAGVMVVTRGYTARLAVERDPLHFGAPSELPALNLPALRHGRPPQDLLSRAVKATRRGFPGIRSVPAEVWEDFVVILTAQVHELTPSGPDGDLLAGDVVDGLARFGWALRLVDVRYGLDPERRVS